jgi:hypothetical protein
MPTRARLQELSQEAKFVFRGTVKQRGATTMPNEVPASRTTLIVTVEEIIQSPDLLRSSASGEITVQLGERQRAQEGRRYIFYTNGWIYGASIAVVALAVVPADETATQQAASAMQAAPAQALQSRTDQAALVVAGRVVEVRDVPRPPDTPISEHDPAWQDALVQVDSVEKGTVPAAPGNQVVVRFAGSTDVRWYRAPKFAAGDEGVWVLRDGATHPTDFAASVPSAGVYTVTDPADFLPRERLEQVRALIR